MLSKFISIPSSLQGFSAWLFERATQTLPDLAVVQGLANGLREVPDRLAMILVVIRRNGIYCEDDVVVQLKRVDRSSSHARVRIDATNDQMAAMNAFE